MDYSADIIDVSNLTGRHEELTDERQCLADVLEEAETASEDARQALEGAEDEAEEPEDTEDEEEALEDAQSTEAEARKALSDWDTSDEASELKMLTDLLDDLCGYGGDYQWNGDWYPYALIKADHFTEYAQQLAEDIGDMPADSWPHRHIDWEAAAEELKQDYSTVDVDGEEYYYR